MCKINNALFQILLARYMGKTKVLCETGAGAHLIATAAACAKFNLPCIGYMGKDDIIKQSTNVLKAKLFNSKVIECVDGSGDMRRRRFFGLELEMSCGDLSSSWFCVTSGWPAS